jgi:glycopeptide antibiotics resistance protein
MKKYLVFWKTIAWTVFIMVLFLIPSQDIPGSREIPHLDKVVHMVFFMIFTILFMRDMLKIKRLKLSSFAYILVTFLVVLSLALMIEGLQDIMKLGREGDIVDIIYDLLGFFLGMFLLVLIFRIRYRSL